MGCEAAHLVRFRYDWDGDASPEFLRTQETEFVPCSEVLFDEETSRCPDSYPITLDAYVSLS